MDKIKSRQNSRIKELVALKNSPGSTFLIEGVHLIELALSANLVEEIFTVKPVFFSAPVTLITSEIADKLTHYKTSQGVFAVVKVNEAPIDTTKNVIYLDELNEPGNVGTIMRTALAFDFGGVITRPNSVNLYNNRVISAAQGAHFLLPSQVGDIDIIEKYKKNGYKVVVTTLEDAVSVNEITEPGPYLIVIGNEARGVSNEVANLASHKVKIPINHIDSLNAAVAAGIIMYEISQKR